MNNNKYNNNTNNNNNNNNIYKNKMNIHINFLQSL
jgi:hypothetical protein